MVNHRIESELRSSAPRRLRRRVGSYGLLASLVVVALAIIFVGCMLMAQTYYTALAKYGGVSVPAQIVGRFTSTSPKSGVNYHLRYRYEWNGNIYENSNTVSRQRYEDLPNGSSAQARLWPPRPDAASYLVFADGNDGASLVWLLLSSILIAALGLCLPANWLIEDRKQRHLLKNGVPGVATVQVMEVGKVLGKSVFYTYEIAKSGEQFAGSLTVNSKKMPPTSEHATVLYDPVHPQRSMLYEFRAYDIVTRD